MGIVKDLDWVTITALFCLALVSLAALYPYSMVNEGNFFLRQLIFFSLGFLTLVLLPFVTISFFKKQRVFIFSLYLLGIFLLIGVLMIGYSIRGSESWIIFLPFLGGPTGIQPSEIIKIVIIFVLARYFAMKDMNSSPFSPLAISGLYAGIPAFFILLQPDLGSALVIFLLWVGVIIRAGVRVRHLLITLFLAVIVIGLSWGSLLKPYQKARISAFLNPESDPLGANYSRNQSLIAIGAGGIFGRGFGANIHSLDGFLPEAHTDFMFSMLAEALGLTGIILIFILYGILIWRLILFKGKDRFDRLFTSSLGLLIFIQASMNIAIALGLLPVTGLTLPFLSYGGSSLISLFIGLGIYQALYVRS